MAKLYYEYCKKIIEECKKYKFIYLYGAGTYGKTFYNYLKKNQILISGFITSDGVGEIDNILIYKAEEILESLSSDSLVILSVREEIQREIIRTNQFNCALIQPTDTEISYIDIANIVEEDFFNVCPKECNNDNILIVQLEVTFGDMLWSTAFLREIRNNYPKARIDYVINEKFLDLYNKCPYVDSLYAYNCNKLNDNISNDMVKRVDEYNSKNITNEYHMAFLPRLLPLSWSDAWENVLVPVRLGIPQIYGHSLYYTKDQKLRCDMFGNILYKIAKHEIAQHEVLNDLDLLKLLNCKIDNNRMELWEEKEYKDTKKIMICVALVGSAVARSWDPNNYAEVFDFLGQRYSNLEIVLLGGRDASDAASIVIRKTKVSCIDMTNRTTLSQAASIISGCDIYLGSDTGLMHMASAYNLYVIEISASNKTSPKYWGCTPTRTGPWCDNYSIVQPEKPLDDCKYMCFKPYSHCINQNTVSDVITEIEKAILFCQKEKCISI